MFCVSKSDSKLKKFTYHASWKLYYRCFNTMRFNNSSRCRPVKSFFSENIHYIFHNDKIIKSNMGIVERIRIWYWENLVQFNHCWFTDYVGGAINSFWGGRIRYNRIFSMRRCSRLQWYTVDSGAVEGAAVRSSIEISSCDYESPGTLCEYSCRDCIKSLQL